MTKTQYSLVTPTKLDIGKLYYMGNLSRISCDKLQKLHSYIWAHQSKEIMFSCPILYLKNEKCSFCETKKNVNNDWKTCKCKLHFLIKDDIFKFAKIYLPMLTTSGTRTFPTPKHIAFQYMLIDQLKEIISVQT